MSGRAASGDEGVALILVIGATVLVATLLLAGLAYAVQSTKYSRYDQDYTAAMTAAQSGVDDFLSRLNRDPDYGKTVDCSNTAMKGPTTCGTAYGWAPVSSAATGATDPAFHYVADASQSQVTGSISLVVTGRVNNVYRTIDVAVGKAGSTDYVYFTDFESADPDNRNAYDSGAPSAVCGKNGATLAKHWWEVPGGRTGCAEIQFGSNDVLDGRVMSNDTILSVGGRFLQSVESAEPECAAPSVVPGSKSTWVNCLRTGSTYVSSGSSATFSTAPAYHSILSLADSSAELADVPGCHYYGATRIIFNSGTPDTMTVWSKNSNFSTAQHRAGAVGRLRPELRVEDGSGQHRRGNGPRPDRSGHLRRRRPAAGCDGRR